MPQSYTPEFKKKIVRLHEEEGRTLIPASTVLCIPGNDSKITFWNLNRKEPPDITPMT